MTQTTAWPNPLIAGFNPDPSIVLVDGVYFLVTSTFEYLPGLPVYRNTNLRQWTQIGNVITRPGQVDIERIPTPGGVCAPTHPASERHLTGTVTFTEFVYRGSNQPTDLQG